MMFVPFFLAGVTWILCKIAQANDSVELLSRLLMVATLLLPLLFQALPSTRRRGGGCCLGCVSWFAMFLVFVWVTDSPWEGESTSPLVMRLDRKIPPTVNGIALRKRASEIPGGEPYPNPPKGYTARQYGACTVIFDRNQQAVAVLGQTLEQNGRTLVRAGDKMTVLRQLVGYDTTIATLANGELYFPFSGDRLTDVKMTLDTSTPRDLPPVWSVDGKRVEAGQTVVGKVLSRDGLVVTEPFEDGSGTQVVKLWEDRAGKIVRVGVGTSLEELERRGGK